MAGSDNEVRMMMSVYPGAMTGFAALNSGLVSINNVFGAMTRSVDAQFGLINTAIITTGVVATQFATDCMSAFGQFEQGMKIVQMVSGQTTEDIKYLKQQANELSVSFRTDIDQITEGLQTLGRAGLNSASEQVEVLENGLSTAKLEGRDLNGVLEELIQNTALLGGDLKSSNFGEQSRYVNDMLVATSMTAPITTHDVSETLKYSGGIAAAAGANIESEEGKRVFEDYLASIAAFAQKGVTGSIAGTALRAFFNKPATQDSSVTEALSSIHLKPEYLWEDDEETMKPVSEQIEIIQKQMDALDVSTMDRLQIWSKIVGGKMGQQMMKLDSSDIKELVKDIRAADDATSLAQGSMRTYEANVKAIGEAGDRFKRNVGEDLVYLANPILTVIAKIAEFLNNDIMSWPFTAGILALITAAARRIKGVFSSIRAEISELLTAYRAGMNYFTQKGGVVRKGDNPLDDAKKAEFYKEHGLGKYGKSGTPGDKKLEESKLDSARTLTDYSKAYKKQITETGSLTLKAFKEAGISQLNTAMAGHLGVLTKDSLGKGITDGTLLKAGFRYNLFNEEELNKLTKGYKGGVNARPMANIIDLESLYNRLIKNDQAVKELGISVEKESAVSKDAEIVHQKQISSINDLIAGRQKEILELKKLISEISSAQIQVVETVQMGASQVELEFLNLMRNISATVSNGATAHRLIPNAVGPFSYIDYNKIAEDIFKKQFNSYGGAMPPGFFGPIPDTKRTPVIDDNGFTLNWKPSNIDPDSSSPQRTKFFEDTNKKDNIVTPVPPKIVSSDEHDKITNDIVKDLRKRLQRDNSPIYREMSKRQLDNLVKLRSTYSQHDISSLNMGKDISTLYKSGDKTVPPTQPQPFGLQGVGSLKGLIERFRILSQEIQQAIIQQREKIAQDAAAAQKEAATKQEVNNKANQEIIRKQAEIDAIMADGDAFALNAAAVDRMTASAEIFVRVMENAWVAPLKDYERIGLTSKQRQDKKDVHTNADLRARDKLAEAGYHPSMRTSSSEQDHSDYIKKEQENGKKILKAQEKRIESLKDPGHRDYVPSKEDIAKREADLINRGIKKAPNPALEVNKDAATNFQRMFGPGSALVRPYESMPTYREKIQSAISSAKQSSYMHPLAALQGSGFYQNFSERINRDRRGNFISFGKEIDKNTGKLRSATTGLKGMGNKLLNLTDIIGGPVMIAFMLIPQIIQFIQGIYEEYGNNLKKLSDNVQDAYSEIEKASNGLKGAYKEYNPDATPEDVENYMLDVYAQRYDDFMKGTWQDKATIKNEKEPQKYEYDEEKDNGSYKEVEEEEKSADETYAEAVKENTGALYAATAQLQASMNSLVTKMQDGMWGIDGFSSQVSDILGGVQDHVFSWDGKGSGFVDEGGFLLTASQKDSNYKGYTEMAGLMLEDFYDAKGNLEDGMRTMLGKDSSSVLSSMNPKGKEVLQNLANFASGKSWGHGQFRLTRAENLKMQQSMKMDKKSWQAAAKEMAKADMKRKGGKEVTSKDTRRLEGYIKKLATETGLSEIKVRQGLQLQQLQDMYAVAEQSMVPLAEQQAQIAAQHLVIGEATSGSAEGSNYGANETAAIAAIIASYVAVVAQAKAGEAYFEAQRQKGDPDALAAKDANEYLSKGYGKNYSLDNILESIPIAGGIYKAGETTGIRNSIFGSLFGEETNKQFNDFLKKPVVHMAAEHPERFYGQMLTLETMGEKSRNPQWSDEQAQGYAEKKLSNYFDSSGNPLYNEDVISKIVRENYADAIAPQLLDQYMGSDIGEVDNDGNGSGGSGGGGGGGGDSKDKDNTGTKKERVDLVLCNKKEIPKLNVNLFKKPPSFTILNKNFKLRDLKINTEDKPKAIMSSIKNAFIDVQKRSDPKIIQDEEAEYDPVAATDGNATPSGSAKTKTDSNKSSN